MNEKWKSTAKRYVCFLDVMGFKDMVVRNTHDAVHKKMEAFLEAVKKWDVVGNKAKDDVELSKIFPNCEIRVATFSDSILLITSGDEIRDLSHLMMMLKLLISDCFQIPIPIKGAISKGLLTADFEKSLFFGKPIIQAYELQDEVNYYGVVVDRYVEQDIENDYFEISKEFDKLAIRIKTPMKSGKISAVNLNLQDNSIHQKHLSKLYYSVEGKPRIYVDNTIEIFNEMCERSK